LHYQEQHTVFVSILYCKATGTGTPGSQRIWDFLEDNQQTILSKPKNNKGICWNTNSRQLGIQVPPKNNEGTYWKTTRIQLGIQVPPKNNEGTYWKTTRIQLGIQYPTMNNEGTYWKSISRQLGKTISPKEQLGVLLENNHTTCRQLGRQVPQRTMGITRIKQQTT
jgi:hypothetical protein